MKRLCTTMRFFFTLWIAKVGYACIRLFGLGSGATWPGHIALKLYPHILRDRHIRFPKGIVCVSGTNGKTTTTKMIRHIIQQRGGEVLHNETGGNLKNGVVSAVLGGMRYTGSMAADTVVFEVDEFALPQVMAEMQPDVLVLLNLSRDQLDRFGETDIIMQRWKDAIATLPSTTRLIAYADQPEFEEIALEAPCSVERFSTDATVSASLSIIGAFNHQNAHAAVLAARALGYGTVAENATSLASFTAAYGRGEVIEYKDTKMVIFLAKNPASVNHNIKLLQSFDPATTAVWWILNDNIPDGRDVSWIYDIDTAALTAGLTPFAHSVVSGTRALDMAIRLQYASLPIASEHVYTSHTDALAHLLSLPVETVLIFPNYSAMLEVRKLLTGNAIL